MKMVSAAKLRGDQQRLAAARPFGVCIIFHFLSYLS
jgi:F0F1-type ATP synthase gamma subunit